MAGLGEGGVRVFAHAVCLEACVYYPHSGGAQCSPRCAAAAGWWRRFVCLARVAWVRRVTRACTFYMSGLLVGMCFVRVCLCICAYVRALHTTGTTSSHIYGGTHVCADLVGVHASDASGTHGTRRLALVCSCTRTGARALVVCGCSGMHGSAAAAAVAVAAAAAVVDVAHRAHASAYAALCSRVPLALHGMHLYWIYAYIYDMEMCCVHIILNGISICLPCPPASHFALSCGNDDDDEHKLY